MQMRPGDEEFLKQLKPQKSIFSSIRQSKPQPRSTVQAATSLRKRKDKYTKMQLQNLSFVMKNGQVEPTLNYVK